MFSQEIKLRAMIACGRCCCICHKYCGNNMELHHIKPKSAGGEDTFENAIPLCFDCHAEVGQYNPKHPKGIKFSEQELIQHRDNWYKQVASGRQEAIENEEPIKIVRQENYQEINLRKISSGKELLAVIDGACALEYHYDEPETQDEARVIADIVRLLNDIMDSLDDYSADERVMLAYDLNDSIKELEAIGYWLFLAVEKSVITGGIKEPADFPILLARIVRKDNPEIIKVAEEVLS